MENIRPYLEEIRRKYNLPALAVALYREGHDDVIAATGVRKQGDPTPVTDDDKFHFGSCSKAVTAALIHKMIDEGKLSITATLSEILPGVQMHEGYRDATIAEVLTHTAGLPENQGFLTDPPAFERGAYHYSNIGYILLGQIAAHLAGKPFEQLVQDEIFTPLGMKSAGFGPPARENASPPNQPWGHKQGKPVHGDNTAEYNAAGRMHGSVGDWLKFLKYEVVQQKDRLLHPVLEARNDQGKPYTDSAFVRVGDYLTHDGSNTLNYTRHVLLPEQNAAFVIVANDGSPNAQRAIGEVSDHLLRKVKGKQTEAVTAQDSYAWWKPLLLGLAFAAAALGIAAMTPLGLGALAVALAATAGMVGIGIGHSSAKGGCKAEVASGEEVCMPVITGTLEAPVISMLCYRDDFAARESARRQQGNAQGASR